MENVLNDPEWNQELNAELCIGDCEKCPHFVVDKSNKMWKILTALCDRSEEKRLREAKLEFMSYVLDIALKKTNQELEEINLLDFMVLLQEKDHYQEECKEAIMLFENNLREQMEKIIYDTIQGIREV